ncbi:MAG: hypothetical protein NTV34_22005 [Proteobacteria bacterium]|nr:hypothetical protein [Pseudomonadota bacterium]
MFWLTLPWIFLTCWIGLGELSQNNSVLRRTTDEMMRSNDSLIQSYARKFGEAPPSLNELRLYAKLHGRNYSQVDSWGGRFEYLRLGHVNYTLRSFGEDGVQNTESSESDPGIFRWGQLVKVGLQYDYESGAHQARPSIMLFAGADDPQRKWHAKLFLDSATGSRRLLVRNKKILNLYMLAPHDGIEEFLWLPDGERLVFTASGSARYADGLWLWDLKKDHASNLLEFEKSHDGLKPIKLERTMFLALSAVSKDAKPKVSVFMAPANNLTLDPAWFFHPQNLHVYEIGLDGNFEHTYPKQGLERERTLFDYEWMGQSTVASGGNGAGLQKAWLKLPRSGSWETAMTSWQEYAVTNAQSPLAAYAVWSLSLFYRDAALEAKGRAKEAVVLKGLSIELSQGVRKMLAAPGWMRAVAKNLVENE